jgi:hypothetical protein
VAPSSGINPVKTGGIRLQLTQIVGNGEHRVAKFDVGGGSKWNRPSILETARSLIAQALSLMPQSMPTILRKHESNSSRLIRKSTTAEQPAFQGGLLRG